MTFDHNMRFQCQYEISITRRTKFYQNIRIQLTVQSQVNQHLYWNNVIKLLKCNLIVTTNTNIANTFHRHSIRKLFTHF